MERSMKRNFVLVMIVVLLSACASPAAPTVVPDQNDPVNTSDQNLPNPASKYCEQQGYTVEIHTTADGSQSGVCIFPDGSECDEWAYYRSECAPLSEATQEPDPTEIVVTAAPSGIPQSFETGAYDGWFTYTHPVYGFSFMLPADWVVVEETSDNSTLKGHLLTIKPSESNSIESIRMTFREAGDEILLWPTGVGQGEFVPQGTLEIGGQPVERILLVCPTGETTSIYYHPSAEQPNIQLGNLEFGLIYNASQTHCEAGSSLEGKTQTTGEMIIASLKGP
jgi:putative hemolysin